MGQRLGLELELGREVRVGEQEAHRLERPLEPQPQGLVRAQGAPFVGVREAAGGPQLDQVLGDAMRPAELERLLESLGPGAIEQMLCG